MSSRTGPQHAVCRLHLSDTSLRLEGPDGLDERIDCGADRDGVTFRRALGLLARRCTGPVVAVLPPTAFTIIPIGRGWRADLLRHFVTQRLAVVAGRRSGGPHLIGVPRAVLSECAALLTEAGFTVEAVEPDPALLPGRQVPAFSMTGTGARPRLPPFVRWRAAGRQGAIPAAVALVAAIGLGALEFRTKDAPLVVATATPGPDAVADDPDAAKTVPAEAPPMTGLVVGSAHPEASPASPAPEAPRPLKRPQLAQDVAGQRSPAPSPLPEIAARAPTTVMMSRNVPPELREAALAASGRNTAESSARMVMLGPVPRPVGVAPAASEAGLRPLARPGGVASTPSLAAGASTSSRPLPRPGDGDDARQIAEAVAAALEIAAADGSGTGAAPGMRPEPRGVAQPAPAQPGGPARTSLPPATVAAGPPRQQAARVAPTRQSARVTTTQQVARSQPQQQAPARSFAPQTARVSGELTLVGVFGTSSRRHALVLLPGGAIQRVRPGETVNGVEIAAVGEDSVRVRVNGRDGVLRLPD